MSNILSQDEVDSLLDGIGEGRVETETDVPEEDDTTRSYDFNSQVGPGHLRMPALGVINERSVSYFRSSLSAVTRSAVDVALSGTESVRFGDFCRGLPLPASMNIFKIKPLRGFALVVLDGQLVFAFVDTFFGGKGVSHVKLEGRGFTTIETKIIHKITNVVLEDLQKAWADFHAVEMQFERSEMDPQFASIVSPNDMVIAIRFKVDLPYASGTISVCIPYSTIEPIRETLQTKYKRGAFEADDRWRRYLKKKISDATVSITCTLGEAEISGRDLLHMKVGDVIPLDQRVNAPVILRVEEVAKFKGYAGSSNNKKAVRIESTYAEE